MNSQIIFTVDSKTKAQAMKRAKRVGIPFASYLRQATEDFAEGKSSMEIVREIRPEKMRLLERESRLMDQGKGTYFASMSEFRKHLRSL